MTASTTAVHLKKSFTCSPPFKVVSKTCPRSYPRGGCASRPVYPLTHRAVLALSQTRSGVGRSAPGSFFCPLPSFSFSFCRDALPASLEYQARHFSSNSTPPFAFNVIYIIARFYCVVYTKRALYLPLIFVQFSQTLKPAKTFSKRIIVQILCTIVPIANFYLCSPCTVFRPRRKDCLYKITYLLLI